MGGDPADQTLDQVLDSPKTEKLAGDLP